MMGINVDLFVFVSRRDDQAQAGFQGVGEAPAQGCKALGARHVAVGGRSGTGPSTSTRHGSREELGKVLMACTLAAGCPTELWTLPRIGKIITRQFAWNTAPAIGGTCCVGSVSPARIPISAPSSATSWRLCGGSGIAGLSISQFYFRFFPVAIRFEQIIEFL